jgi:cytidylate kinase
VALFVISGVSASGKSAVARLLAETFERGVCVPGDTVREMMVSGRVDMRPSAGDRPIISRVMIG